MFALVNANVPPLRARNGDFLVDLSRRLGGRGAHRASSFLGEDLLKFAIDAVNVTILNTEHALEVVGQLCTVQIVPQILLH